jgi:hypothetical protein
MSYSFSTRGSSKEDASANVATELANVVNGQPVHAADQDEAQAAADAFITLLPDDDTRDIAVSLSGSVSTTDDGQLSQASVSVSVGLVAKVQA